MRKSFQLLPWLLSILLLTDAQASRDPALRPWNDYRVIMWIGDSAAKRPEKFPLFLQRLLEMGVNTAMVSGDSDPAPFVTNHFPYYVENMVNRGLCLKFNSNVRDWDKFVTDWNKNGRPKSAMIRDYCLDDPQWRDQARKEVERIATRNKPFHPLAYNLRDELSVTYSANPFDYDFSAISLAAFRTWLHGQYASLAELNSEWETKFSTWDEVTPFTTDEIKARMSGQKPNTKPDWQELRAMRFDAAEARKSAARWNFAPWCDFRSFMDFSLASALGDMRLAIHKIDPETPVGIEGTQMPSAFGGYDFRRLTDELDWVEAYDIGNARDIMSSFMKFRPVLTTVFEKDTEHARRRLWHLLLEGDRGCIIWWSEDCIDFNSPNYALTPKAKALAPVLKEMTSPLAQLFFRAEHNEKTILILYSQPSIQVDWMMESAPDGVTWQRRFSSYEAANNHMSQVRDGWVKAIQDIGYNVEFIGADFIDAGILSSSAGPGITIVLTDGHALSDTSAKEINACAEKFSVLYDALPGTFDGHGKLRTTNAIHLAETNRFAGDPADYAKDRLSGKSAANNLAQWLAKKLGAPNIALNPEDHVRAHRYFVKAGELLAFERNVEYAMSENLSQAGGNELLEKPINLVIQLPSKKHLYDLNTTKYLGYTDRLEFTLDPWRPSLFAEVDRKMDEGTLLEDLAK